MRHLYTIKAARDVLAAAYIELVEQMQKDPNHPIHMLDHTPKILRDIGEAIDECDTYDLERLK